MLEAWQVSLIAAGSSLLGSLVGAFIAYLTNAQRLNAERRNHWNEDVVTHVTALYRYSVNLKDSIAGLNEANAGTVEDLTRRINKHAVAIRQEATSLTFIAPKRIRDAAIAVAVAATAWELAERMLLVAFKPGELQDVPQEKKSRTKEVLDARSIYENSVSDLEQATRKYLGIKELRTPLKIRWQRWRIARAVNEDTEKSEDNP